MVSRLLSEHAIQGRLGITGGVTSGMIPGIDFTFEPSIAITTGRINKLGMSFRSFREPLTKSIRDVMMESIGKNFDVGGRPPWEPLSEATLSIREYYGYYSDEILMWTGRLANVASSFGIWDITQTYATITSLPGSVWYGKIQQAGYGGMAARIKKAGGNMGDAFNSLQADIRKSMRDGHSDFQGFAAAIPPRPFILFQDEDADKITEIFLDWMDKKIQEAWPAGV